MDGGAWWAAVHGVAKSQIQLSDFILTFHFHALEKEKATHTSVLAWRIPRTEEPWWVAIYGITQSQTRLPAAAAVLCNNLEGCYGVKGEGEGFKSKGTYMYLMADSGCCVAEVNTIL